MSSPTSMLHVRIDDETKLQAQQALKSMGMSVSDAVRIFLTRVGAEWVDHALSGNQWKNCRELHVGGDFLLIYRIEALSKFEMVVFVRTGTHSELFK